MPLPPWLDISPAQFGQAAAEGSRIRLQRAQLQQSAADSAARLGMEQQRLNDAEKQTAMDNQIRQQQIAANFQRAQTQTAVTQAYHQAMIGLGKQRIEDAATKTATAHQTAARMLDDREKETFKRVSDSPEQPPKPATTATIPFLSRLGITTGITPGNSYQPGKEKGTLTETVKAPVGTSPADAFRAAAPGAPGTAPAAPAPNATPKQFTDKSGAVFSYTGTSDDPASDQDPSHWQTAAQ
jgi:hypothetical protein